jgi:hypothetical protein
VLRALSLVAVTLAVSTSAAAQEKPPAPAATAAAPAAAPAAPVPALVVLKDGQQLRGKLVSQDATGATIELEGGARVVVPAASIARIELARAGQTEVRSKDPNRTRYLYSPSGFMLKQGEGYVSQTELLVTSVAYGLTSWLTVGLGSSIPFLFVEDGVNLVGTIKLGFDAGEYVHLAAGAQTLWLPGVEAGTTAGVAFGTVTLGTPDLHLGVSAGPVFVAGDEANDVGDVLVSISGTARVSERIAVVSENWFLPQSDNAYALSGAVRFIGQRLAVDAGLIFVEGADVPIPWLDFTFNFGQH